MALLFKMISGLTALVLLVVTLFGSIITLGGVLLSAIKILIIVIFIALVVAIILSILRDRSRRKRESAEF